MYNHKDGILIRKADKNDLPQLLALKSESWWGTHNTLIANIYDQFKWFESMSDREMCVIAMKGADAVACGFYSDIDWVNRSVSVSGSVFKEYRKPDIVKASFSAGLDFVFEILNMRRVNAEVLSYNVAAQKIHIGHLGFAIEGIRREAVYKCGRYYDSVLLGLLRTEWEQQERIKSYGGSCNMNFDPERNERIMNRFSVANIESRATQDSP